MPFRATAVGEIAVARGQAMPLDASHSAVTVHGHDWDMKGTDS